jgi:predicted amidohydrolase
MLAPLSVAAAQPRCAANNVRSNARAHAELIRAARARIVVFPELSLTGYQLDADPPIVIEVDGWRAGPGVSLTTFSAR